MTIIWRVFLCKVYFKVSPMLKTSGWDFMNAQGHSLKSRFEEVLLAQGTMGTSVYPSICPWELEMSLVSRGLSWCRLLLPRRREPSQQRGQPSVWQQGRLWQEVTLHSKASCFEQNVFMPCVTMGIVLQLTSPPTCQPGFTSWPNEVLCFLFF